MTKTQSNGMRAITADCGSFVSGTIDSTPSRLARGSSPPQSLEDVTRQLLDAAQHHSEHMIGAAHKKVLRELDHAIGRLTRVEYNALLTRVVHSIARRRPQRDNG